MMTPELKAEWIAALRSGDYKQGQNSLRDCEDNYCCLGVLCDIIPGNKWELLGSYYEAHLAPHNMSTAVFPASLRKEYGLRKAISIGNSVLDYDETLHDRLIDMNDSGASFSHIADYIEANL